MKFRTLALALALCFGVTGLVEAKQAKKAVIHRKLNKVVKARKAKPAKVHKAKRGKVVKSHRG